MNVDSGSSQSATAYTVLEDGERPLAVARPAAPVVVVYESVEKRKRSFGCGCCCLGTLLVVLLCSLLVPRTPYIGFRQFNVAVDENNQYNLEAEMRFKSRQPVQAEWKDLEVKLQWRRDDGTDQEVAKFKKHSDFFTDAFGDKIISSGLEETSLVLTTTLAIQCLNSQVLVRFKGHVKSKDAHQKYALETDWTYVQCYI